MTKQELRNNYKEKRNQISQKQKLIWDDLLLIQFQKIAFFHVTTIFTYRPIEELNEPETYHFIAYLQSMIPSLRVAYPVANFITNEMKAIEINDTTNFLENKKGIIEPEMGNMIDAKEIDAVIVPLLVFDKYGNRLGYGKGFYDKYLATCRKNCMKIGVSYFAPIDKIEDSSSFDIPLTHCITPEAIYEF